VESRDHLKTSVGSYDSGYSAHLIRQHESEDDVMSVVHMRVRLIIHIEECVSIAQMQQCHSTYVSASTSFDETERKGYFVRSESKKGYL